MQPYQEEYIANLKDIAANTARKKPEGLSFEAYQAELSANRGQIEQKVMRNMELLKGELFPLLDHLLEADETVLAQLQEFAATVSVRRGTGRRALLPYPSGAVESGAAAQEPEQYDRGVVLAGAWTEQPLQQADRIGAVCGGELYVRDAALLYGSGRISEILR